MGSPNWEFDEHFSSLHENSIDDTNTYNDYIDEVEEELYYQVYFDKTEDSKLEENSFFKIENIPETNEEDATSNSTRKKIKSVKGSNISESLEVAGMSITELKRILKQNDDIISLSSSSRNISSCSEGDESELEDKVNDSDDDSTEYTDDGEMKTEDMKFNFNDDPDDDQLRTILKDMPDSVSEWKVEEQVLESYMKRKVKCLNCNNRGHMSYTCPMPKRLPRCILCSKEGHRMNKCREQTCFRCHQEGHSIKQCSSTSTKDFQCLRCCLRGHLVRECPDAWRQYHLNTGEKTQEILVASDVNKIKYCFNCARDGHIAFECRDRRMNNHQIIASPFIYKYDWKGRHNLNQNQPKQNEHYHNYNNNNSNYHNNNNNNNSFIDNLKNKKHISYGTDFFHDIDERSNHTSNHTSYQTSNYTSNSTSKQSTNNINSYITSHNNNNFDAKRRDVFINVLVSSDDEKYYGNLKKQKFEKNKKSYDFYKKKMKLQKSKNEKWNKAETVMCGDYLSLESEAVNEMDVGHRRNNVDLPNGLEKVVRKNKFDNKRFNNASYKHSSKDNKFEEFVENSVRTSTQNEHFKVSVYKKKNKFANDSSISKTTIKDRKTQRSFNDYGALSAVNNETRKTKRTTLQQKRSQESHDFPRGSETRKELRRNETSGDFLKFSQVDQPNFPNHPSHQYNHAFNDNYHPNQSKFVKKVSHNKFKR